MRPGVDYIEIKRDFSNIDEVLDKVRDHAYCEKIAQQCYDHVIRPGDADNPYTYRWFANHVVDYIEEHRDPTADKEMTPAMRAYMTRRCARLASRPYKRACTLALKCSLAFAYLWSKQGRARLRKGLLRRLGR